MTPWSGVQSCRRASTPLASLSPLVIVKKFGAHVVSCEANRSHWGLPQRLKIARAAAG